MVQFDKRERERDKPPQRRSLQFPEISDFSRFSQEDLYNIWKRNHLLLFDEFSNQKKQIFFGYHGCNRDNITRIERDGASNVQMACPNPTLKTNKYLMQIYQGASYTSAYAFRIRGEKGGIYILKTIKPLIHQDIIYNGLLAKSITYDRSNLKLAFKNLDLNHGGRGNSCAHTMQMFKNPEKLLVGYEDLTNCSDIFSLNEDPRDLFKTILTQRFFAQFIAIKTLTFLHRF